MVENAAFPLRSPRRGHTATLLVDGRVLLAGGAKPVTPERAAVCDFDDPCSLASAEIVDPEALSSELIAPMLQARESHAAALVPGGVLVIGGVLSGGGCLRTPGSVERFDLVTGRWSAQPSIAGLLAPSTTELASGGILLAGGLGERVTASVSIREHAAATWRAGAGLFRGRYLHAAELLADGRVLVAGGLGQTPDGTLVALASAAIYDAQKDAWSEAAPMHHARAEPSLTRLEDGSVLALGGYGDDPSVLASAELYDPETDTWTEVGAMHRARVNHTVTSLPNGRALVVGGIGGQVDAPSTPWPEAELFNLETQSFGIVASRAPRAGHTATRLGDGRVLIAGGGPQTAEILAA